MPFLRGSLEPERVTGAIYGTILTTALVAGLSEDASLSTWQVAYWLVISIAVFALAHLYANLVALRLRRGGLRPADVLHELRLEWPMLQAVVLPEAAVVLAGARLWSREIGVELAIWVGIASLFGWSVAVGRKEGLRPLGILLTAAITVAFGLVLVLLKIAIG